MLGHYFYLCQMHNHRFEGFGDGRSKGRRLEPEFVVAVFLRQAQEEYSDTEEFQVQRGQQSHVFGPSATARRNPLRADTYRDNGRGVFGQAQKGPLRGPLADVQLLGDGSPGLPQGTKDGHSGSVHGDTGATD